MAACRAGEGVSPPLVLYSVLRILARSVQALANVIITIL